MHTVKVNIFQYEDNTRTTHKTIHIGMFDFPAKPDKHDYIIHDEQKYIIDAIVFDCGYDYIEIMVYHVGGICDEL